jgi:hypothetical protein
LFFEILLDHSADTPNTSMDGDGVESLSKTQASPTSNQVDSSSIREGETTLQSSYDGEISSQSSHQGDISSLSSHQGETNSQSSHSRSGSGYGK